jgi:hypothetical protein
MTKEEEEKKRRRRERRRKQENKYKGTIVKPHTFTSYGVSVTARRTTSDAAAPIEAGSLLGQSVMVVVEGGRAAGGGAGVVADRDALVIQLAAVLPFLDEEEVGLVVEL